MASLPPVTDGVPGTDGSGCEFCDIVARRGPADIRYEDERLIVFRNRLRWVPLMLLIAPREHMSQHEFWTSPLFAEAAALAVRIGHEDAPDGFRLASNFGEDALQTQPHAHLHIVGGAGLGLYLDFEGKGDFWQRIYGGGAT